MLKVCGELDFLQESLGADDGGELRVKHLDRHLPAKPPQVLGEKHPRHATRANLAQHRVPLREGTAEWRCIIE